MDGTRNIRLAAAVAVALTTLLSATAATARATGCIVPRLTGDTLAQARTKLEHAHCTVGKITGPRTGKITSQAPKAGRHEKRGTKVTVTLKTKTGTTTLANPIQTTTASTPAPTPAAPVVKEWDSDSAATISTLVVGSSATTTLTDPDGFDGAISVTLTDQLGDTCNAVVSGTSASCKMTVTGTPSSYQVAYPGGDTTSTTEWPADQIAITNPSVSVSAAVINALDWSDVTEGGSGWTATIDDWVPSSAFRLDADVTGNVPGDTFATGYLTFAVVSVDGQPEGSDSSYWSDQNQVTDADNCTEVETDGASSVGCAFSFHAVGTFQIQVTFTSTDPDYQGTSSPIITVDVS
jgi:hypothetical protein